jgi:hypothetical protein
VDNGCGSIMATRGGEVSDRKDKKDDVRLTDERRIDWLRLIRNPNVGPHGYRANVTERTLGQK